MTKDVTFFLPDWADQENIRTVHFFDRTDPRAGGVTIVYRPHVTDEFGYPCGLMADISVSYCKAGDSFCRYHGRINALQRMYNGESIALPIYRNGHPVRMLREMFCDTMEVANPYNYFE